MHRNHKRFVIGIKKRRDVLENALK